MKYEDDPVARQLAGIARRTQAAAPAPKPFALVRILAARRRDAAAARRILVATALASLMPACVVGVAWLLHPDFAAAAPMATALIGLLLAPALAAAARTAGMPRRAMHLGTQEEK
jgi:hypothetical protein